MNRLKASFLGLAVLAGCAAHVPGTLAAEVRQLPDSTRLESWRLPNGLRVVVRHIPRSRAAAITFAVGGGSDHDPAGREGFASLVSEVVYFSATGDVPERKREEMESLRPLGWSVKATGDFTQFGEVASPTQFPGVFHQMAQRFKSVTVTEAGLKSAAVTVQRELAGRFAGRVDHALYYGVRELGKTGDLARARRFASGRGVQGVKVADVQKRIAEILVPANAVLSIAGNVGGVDLQRLIERELGSLAPGVAIPHDTVSFRAADRVEPMPGVVEPVGVVGIIAPALTDTLHAEFYLHALVFAAMGGESWGQPKPPLTSLFQYPVLDDPGLVRYYAPIIIADSIRVAEEFNLTMRQVPMLDPESDALDRFRAGILWLFGGPLGETMAARARTESSVVFNISAAQAARELWADEKFWDGYRERLQQATSQSSDRWRGYFVTTRNQVRLGFKPAASKTSRR